MPVQTSRVPRVRRTTRVSRTVLVLAVSGIAGLLMLIAAERLQRPVLIGPGLLLFAVGTVAAGVQAVVARYVLETNRVSPTLLSFEGTSAVLVGISLVVLGVAIGIAGAAFVVGMQRGLYDFVIARPGIALLPAGVSVAALGGSRLLGARQWRGSLVRLLANIPERIGGAVLVVIGIALAGVGGFELVAPEAFDEAAASLVEGREGDR